MAEIDLKTTVGGLSMNSCIYNAAGPLCVTREELLDLAKCPYACAITSKSCTKESRTGNPEPRYWDNDQISINSQGLPNLGYKFYADMAAEIQSSYASPELAKPYIVSVSGFSLEDNIEILTHLVDIPNVHGIELNLSCPNVIGKPQVGYEFETTKKYFAEVERLVYTKERRESGKKLPPFGVKLPPYFDVAHFEAVAAILNTVPYLSWVTCINSIGNGLVVDAESETAVIKPKGGLGGLGGTFVKPTALANVRQFRLLLDPRIDVIGCGGVLTGVDAFEHILCGASAVQVATQLWKEGPACFERITNELKAVMQKKGYKSIEDFRGKLKTL